MMIEVLKAVGYAAFGGLLVHVSWLHAWNMYKRGKQEGGWQ